MEETKKRCPYCGEEILVIAKKCKHCGEWLEKGESQSPTLNVDVKEQRTIQKKGNSSFLIAILIIVLGIILVVAIQVFFKNNNETSPSPTTSEEIYSNPSNEELEKVEREIQDTATDEDDYNDFVIN